MDFVNLVLEFRKRRIFCGETKAEKALVTVLIKVVPGDNRGRSLRGL